MRAGNGKFMMIFILGIIVAGIAYTACKDITPAQERIETEVDVKLSK